MQVLLQLPNLSVCDLCLEAEGVHVGFQVRHLLRERLCVEFGLGQTFLLILNISELLLCAFLV
jgi:hypothetical protein